MEEEELLYLLENPYREEISEFVPNMVYDEEGKLESVAIIIVTEHGGGD